MSVKISDLPTATEVSSTDYVVIDDGTTTSKVLAEKLGGGITLLWTNSSPTTSFSAQTVSVDLSEYEWIIVKAYQQMNWLFQKGDSGWMIYVADVMYRRSVGVNNNGVTFGDGKYRSTYAGSETTNGSACVPYQIYGIKL